MRKEIKEKLKKIGLREVPKGYMKFRYGIIPEDWVISTIEDIANITRLAGAEYSDLWKVDDNGEIIALRGFNIKNNRLDLSEVDRISSDLSQRLIRSKLYVDDIVYPCVGTIGNACVIRENDRYHINQNIAKISPLEGISSDFIAYYLMSEYSYKEIIRYNTSSTQPNILVGNLRRFVIPVPKNNFEETKKISEILSTWDKAIELKEKLIEEKKNQKNGLMQKLLTGKVRLPGFDGEWREVRVSKAIKESKIVESEPFLEKQITVRLHLNGVQVRDINGTEKLGATTLYKRFSGQFIYGKQNFHNGALGLIPSELDGYVTSSDIPSFDFNNGFDPLFFFYYWSRSNIYNSLEGLTTGTGSKRLNPKTFLNLNMKVPGLEEQERISQVIRVCDKEIQLLEKELEHLKQQKKGLMQLLLTGIVRVNTQEN